MSLSLFAGRDERGRSADAEITERFGGSRNRTRRFGRFFTIAKRSVERRTIKK